MKTKLLLLAFIFISLGTKAQSGNISTIAGTGTFAYSGDGGQATAAHLNNPNGIAFDPAGNMYFADLTNNVIRKVTKSTGIITTVAGTYYTGSTWYYGGDGGPADSAWLAGPIGIATDTAGNLYIADNLNNVIRKVTASTGIISTVAGDATLIGMPYAFSGDGGQATAAELGSPWGVALDAAGNIYIAEQSYNVIRKITVSTGIITTVAGNGTGGYNGDNGLATSAELNAPDGVTVDTAGNIYISDDGNNVIRKVMASTGKITTIAGNGVAGYTGDGGAATSAELNDPSLGVALDASGNIYIADDVNNVIRKITASTGKISTIAGNGTLGYSGDGGPADSALLNGPEAVAIDAAGNIYIADGNNVIRKITGAGGSIPASPAAIIGNTSVCYHSTNTYSVVPVNGATSYTWTLPNGWSGTSTTDTMIATAGASGTISVTANNSSGSSLPQTFNVTVTNINTSVTPTGLTLTAVANGAAYAWINCSGNTAVPGATQQSFTATVAGNYAVIITQNSCIDTSACYLADTTGSAPPTPTAIQGNNSVCYHSTNTFSVAPVTGATSYTWTLPNGWSGISTTDTMIATADTSGTISVTANNSFGSSTAQTLNVTVNTINTSVTQAGLTLTAGTSGAAYIWINCDSNTAIAGATHQSFTATAIGSYAVIITKNGCTDTSACFSVDSLCNIEITGADLPYSGLSVMLAVDTSTSVSIGNPGGAQTWDYSMLRMTYPKFAVYTPTSATAYASVYPASNIDTYGPSVLFGSLYGGAPVSSPGMGYVFWKSDSTGLWVTGFRTESGLYANINVQDNPHELLIGAPASYGSTFTDFARWVLPLNFNPANIDTYYVCNIHKVITADACGTLTTPSGVYPNVLRQHEYVVTVDSVYITMSGIPVTSFEFSRDTLNNYLYIAHGLGYPACIVHADVHNTVMNVEYYTGVFAGLNSQPEADSKFLLYPNPSDGKITIEISNSSAIDNQVSMYNSVGSLVWQKNTSDVVINMDISSLAKGLYFVKVFNGQKVQTEKIVIQ